MLHVLAVGQLKENDFVQPVFYNGGNKLLVFEQLYAK